MKQHRPRRPNPFMVYQSRGAIIPPFLYSPYGYGYASINCHQTCGLTYDTFLSFMFHLGIVNIDVPWHFLCFVGRFPGSECQCVTAPTTEGSILLDAALVVRRGCNHVKQYSLLILFMDMLSED